MKYTGPWNKQCPYCGSHKVKQQGEWQWEDGEKYWEPYDSAVCLKCGAAWLDYEASTDPCPGCGVHHSHDITTEDAHRIAYYACKACGCIYTQDSGRLVDISTIEWKDD
jgi:hypothetical protein